MKIPLLDLRRKYLAIETELRQEWEKVFASMQLLNGPNLRRFEHEFAAYCGARHAIGVASGTDAIYLSLLALGISSGGEVILPAHAPAPVIEPIFAVGATPVLVDKAKGDYGPDLGGLQRALSSKTKAIIAVHLLGLPCDMDAISSIIGGRDLWLIEDASQAHGANYKKRRAAGLGHITPMSLGPVKNLACYGDGGVVLTDDDSIARRLQLLRVHGQAEKYDHQIYGWNSRLDEIQAATLLVKLPTLDQDNARRRQIAGQYSEAFHDLPLKTPPTFADRASVYHQYVVETVQRDGLREFLTHRGIGTGMYYPEPLHQHRAWRDHGLPVYSLPESERYARQNLALPVFAELGQEEVDCVISAVREYFSRQGSR